MGEKEKKTWGIHTFEEDLFLNNGVVAIGWDSIGNLKKIKTDREEFKKAYSEIYPEQTKVKVAGAAGLLYRFVCEMNIGDYIIFPSKKDGQINIGTITSDYIYENKEKFAHRRKVKWLKQVPRENFTQGALYEIGTAMTLFLVRKHTAEFLKKL